MNNKEYNVEIYTDGSCLNNTNKQGIGGFGAVLICNGKEKKICGSCTNTTNNQMELLAVIEALKQLKCKCNVIVYTDSMYIVEAINKRWLDRWVSNNWTRGKNKELKNVTFWKELKKEMDKHNIKFVWVKGHSGDYYNELCDSIAEYSSRKQKQYMKMCV